MKDLFVFLVLIILGLFLALLLWRLGREIIQERRFLRRPPEAAPTKEQRDLLRHKARDLFPPERNVALVLSGGGAKGAYEIGCWKALREAGVNDFIGIAGTSVGALNAALVAQDKFEAAESIWAGIRLRDVLSAEFFATAKSFFVRVPLIPYYLFKYSKKNRQRLVPSFWEAAYFYREEQQRHGIWGLALYQAVFKHLLRGRIRHFWSDTLFQLLFFWAVAVIVGTTVEFPEELKFLTKVLIAVPSLLCCFVVLWWWLLQADHHIGTTVPIASNNPLAQMLEEHVDPPLIANCAAPVFVTLATLRKIASPKSGPTPDYPALDTTAFPTPSAPEASTTPGPTENHEEPAPPKSWLSRWWQKHVTGNRKSQNKDFISIPASAEKELVSIPEATPERLDYVPHYFRLQDHSEQDMKKLILQSAALPEIFARKVLSGNAYVDGGIADNTPFLPLLEATETDIAIVIWLEAQQRVDTLLDDMRDMKDRAARAESFSTKRENALSSDIFSEFAAALQEPPAPLDIRGQRNQRDVRILPVVPSRELGGFLFGTLNFCARKSQSLMQLGYEDMMRVLLDEEPKTYLL